MVMDRQLKYGIMVSYMQVNEGSNIISLLCPFSSFYVVFYSNVIYTSFGLFHLILRCGVTHVTLNIFCLK